MKISLTFFLTLLFAQISHADFVKPSDLTTLDGLEVSVWATSPMFYNPTNMDVDKEGRIWVVEAVNYRMFKNNMKHKHAEGDRVVWMQDTNGDGTADKSQVFVQDKDIVAPLGIGVIGNEVYVSSAPHILRYTDVNENGVFDKGTDKKEIWLDGFGGKDHDHSLHAIKAGPDGRFYFNAGNAGPHIVTDKSGWTLRAGSSYNSGAPSMGSNKPGLVSDDGRMWVGGVALRIEPDGTGLHPIGHNFRNSYEECVTSFGDVFQNDNDDPPACRTTWLMRYGNLGFSSADGTRTWRADQRPGQDVATAEWRQEDPGTIPAGDIYGNGAPTGICFYENGALDPRWEGMLLSCESAQRVVYGYLPVPEGAGFKLERFDFLKPSGGDLRSWFRPADVTVGVDGAIYVSDWFDPGVGGHRMRDEECSGTIYRIAPKGFEPKVPKFDLKTIDGQITALRSPAPNVRYLGYRELTKGSDEQVEVLAAEAFHPNNPYLAARALHAFGRMESKKDGLIELLYGDDTEDQFRVLAHRVLLQQGKDPVELAEKGLRANSIALNREALLALRDVTWEKKHRVLPKLVEAFDGNDRWYLEAIGTAAEGNEADLWVLVNKPDPLHWDAVTTSLAWRLHPDSAIAALKTRAMADSLSAPARKKMIDAIAFNTSRVAAEAMVAIGNKGPKDHQAYATWWGRNRHNNDWKAYNLIDTYTLPPPKVAAKGKQVKSKSIDIPKTAKRVYKSNTVKWASRVYADVDIAGAGTLYLVVQDAGDSVNSDWADWVEPELIGPGGSTSLVGIPWTKAASQWGQVRVNKNASGGTLATIDGPAKKGIGTHAHSVIVYNIAGQGFTRFKSLCGIDAGKKDGPGSVVFEVYVEPAPETGLLDPKKILALKGNVDSGAKLFAGQASCIACHQHGKIGNNIGPDLTQIGDKFDQTVILEAMMNPSTEIAFGYETWEIKKKDDSTVTGFLIADADPIILKDAGGQTHTIATSELASRKQYTQSIMPPISAYGLSNQQAADLLSFLTGK